MRAFLSARFLLIFSLFMGTLFSVMLTPHQQNTVHEFMWQVQVDVHKGQRPVIESVQKVQVQSISPLLSGNSYIELQSVSGESLYKQEFQVSFITYDAPTTISEISLVFLLPNYLEATQIFVHSPQGDTVYDIR